MPTLEDSIRSMVELCIDSKFNDLAADLIKSKTMQDSITAIVQTEVSGMFKSKQLTNKITNIAVTEATALLGAKMKEFGSLLVGDESESGEEEV